MANKMSDRLMWLCGVMKNTFCLHCKSFVVNAVFNLNQVLLFFTVLLRISKRYPYQSILENKLGLILLSELRCVLDSEL